MAAVESELRTALRPELLNRIDSRIVFDALTRDDLDLILEIQLKRVEKMLAQRDLGLELTQAARTSVCDMGYDPAYGARPLKRAITQYLLNPMSSSILEGGYLPGDTIQVDAEDNHLVFTRVPGPDSEASDEGEAPKQLEARTTPPA